MWPERIKTGQKRRGSGNEKEERKGCRPDERAETAFEAIACLRFSPIPRLRQRES